MTSVLTNHASFAAFAGGTILAFAAQAWWLRGMKSSAVRWLVWSLAAGLLGAAWLLIGRAAEREKVQIQDVLLGFARLYASEIEIRGHWRLSGEILPDDPLYLELIAMEKRWLELNPSIHDIYTMRRQPDGRCVFVVDAETDYDRNGRYEGEREGRTTPGEVYPDPDAGMEQAFLGHTAFDLDPATDRWGTWVSAYVPLHTPDKTLDGLLGVDFEGHAFIAQIAAAEARVIGFMAIPLLLLLAASTLISVIRTGARRQDAVQDKLRDSEEKLRQIFEHSAQVFYSHTPDGQLTYVSPQVATFLDCTPEEAMTKWTDFLTDHPLNAEGVTLTDAAIHTGQAQRRYQLELRPRKGRVFWAEVNETPVVVNGRTAAIVGALTDITERKRAEEAVRDLHGQLVDASRRSGMAEVASDVLHNVGNVLNSANVSVAVATDRVRKFKVGSLRRLAEMLNGQPDLAAFVTNEPRGAELPAFLTHVAAEFGLGQAAALKELDELRLHIEHVNEIVAVQLRYAKAHGVTEVLPLADLIEDALRLNAGVIESHRLHVVRNFARLPAAPVDRHRVLQILVNLIQNAKHALDEAAPAEKRLTLTLTETSSGRAAVSVTDNGVGIPRENLTRIFAQGFTTRRGGHGFGLHGSANAAQEMGGSLTAQSNGAGQGATFTLELPLASEVCRS